MPYVGDLLSDYITLSYCPGTGTGKATKAQSLAALATQSVDTEILEKCEKIKWKRRAWSGLRRTACERRPSSGWSVPTGSLPLLNTPPLANSKVPCLLAWPLPSPRLTPPSPLRLSQLFPHSKQPWPNPAATRPSGLPSEL